MQGIWNGLELVGIYEGNELFYVRTDHIARPVFATDANGTVVWEASYLPFGGVQSSTGGPDLRFPGQWFQSESGLHQNWMRDYDPTLGRYLQADPLGIEPGPALFTYALNAPTINVDPDGRNPYAWAFKIYTEGMKIAVKKLLGKRIKRAIRDNAVACWGTRRDHFMSMNCPADCPKRVIGIGLNSQQGQATAKLAAPPHCRAFYGHFQCKRVKDILK